MVEFSIFHWLIVILLVTFLIPIARILRRTGHSPLWCLLWFVPLANVIALWVFAFKPWPVDTRAT